MLVVVGACGRVEKVGCIALVGWAKFPTVKKNVNFFVHGSEQVKIMPNNKLRCLQFKILGYMWQQNKWLSPRNFSLQVSIFRILHAVSTAKNTAGAGANIMAP